MHRNFVASRAAAFFVVGFAVVVLVNCQAASAVERFYWPKGSTIQSRPLSARMAASM